MGSASWMTGKICVMRDALGWWCLRTAGAPARELAVDKQDEKLKDLIKALRPLIKDAVEDILAEKLREDPHILEDIRTGPGVNRQSFIDRRITK
jgi:hypothetical protein